MMMTTANPGLCEQNSVRLEDVENDLNSLQTEINDFEGTGIQ